MARPVWGHYLLGFDSLNEVLQRSAGIVLRDGPAEPLGGGSINHAYRVPSSDGPLFVKINVPSALSMLEAEAAGLEALRRAQAVSVPSVIAVGVAGDAAYLVLEWLELGPKSAATERSLGRCLARLHRVTSMAFGWDRDNTIGSTVQVNAPSEDWLAFFRERRLRYQLDLAERNGLPSQVTASGMTLLENLDGLLGDHRPRPSLLHGDLWGGNWGASRDRVPVIFDPAVYYGDREADLAMTRLFGGFGGAFYEAYEAEWALPVGWERRSDLYNLYHLLNHFNLFGKAYVEPVRASIGKLARALR